MDGNTHGDKVRALIVDDSSVIRLVLGRILHEADLGLTDLVQASNGQQALDILREDAAASRHFDVILCDINMPVMNGIEFLESRHTEDLAPGVPVLVIATEACRPQVLNALAAGAKGYITKPFTAGQVKDQLAQLLQAA